MVEPIVPHAGVPSAADAPGAQRSRQERAALTHYLEDGAVLCDSNWVENQIRPIAIGRSN